MGPGNLFALDWRGLAEKGVLGDVLRLFSLRYAWLKEGDQKAYAELARARRAADPNIRGAAELLFSEMALDKQPKAPLDGNSEKRAANQAAQWPSPDRVAGDKCTRHFRSQSGSLSLEPDSTHRQRAQSENPDPAKCHSRLL